jgi:hypothetical protein
MAEEPKKPAVPPVILSDATRNKVAQMIRRTMNTKPLKLTVKQESK